MRTETPHDVTTNESTREHKTKVIMKTLFFGLMMFGLTAMGADTADVRSDAVRRFSALLSGTPQEKAAGPNVGRGERRGRRGRAGESRAGQRPWSPTRLRKPWERSARGRRRRRW